MDSKKVKENYMDEMRTKPKWKYVNEFGGESELRRRHYKNNENNCKKRKKHRGPEDDDDDKYFNIVKDDKEEILPKWKIFAVGAAIFLCFAILYPSVFGPLIGSLFGGNKGGDHSAQNQRNIHPSMMGAHPKQRGVRSANPVHPHPASPQMVHQGQGGGGGRGGFAWLLPFYTIGVVCFLLYTLFKIMFKSKKKKKLKKNEQKLTMWDEDDEEDSDEDRIQGVRGQKLHSVQARLRKTEHAMHEILHQLELIANQAEQFWQPQSKDDDPNPTNENQSNTEKQGTDGDLTGEQTIQMEMKLKELKILSEMVKRDHLLRSRLREHSSTELSDETEEDDLQNNEEIDSQTGEESELEEEEGPRKTII